VYSSLYVSFIAPAAAARKPHKSAKKIGQKWRRKRDEQDKTRASHERPTWRFRLTAQVLIDPPDNKTPSG
jgi:hypothetical protein